MALQNLFSNAKLLIQRIKRQRQNLSMEWVLGMVELTECMSWTDLAVSDRIRDRRIKMKEGD